MTFSFWSGTGMTGVKGRFIDQIEMIRLEGLTKFLPDTLCYSHAHSLSD